jgi:hypothetical protein
MKRDATGRRKSAGRGGAPIQPSAAAASAAAAARSSSSRQEETHGTDHAPLGGIRNMMQVFGSSHAAAVQQCSSQHCFFVGLPRAASQHTLLSCWSHSTDFWLDLNRGKEVSRGRGRAVC